MAVEIEVLQFQRMAGRMTEPGNGSGTEGTHAAYEQAEVSLFAVGPVLLHQHAPQLRPRNA